MWKGKGEMCLKVKKKNNQRMMDSMKTSEVEHEKRAVM